MSHGRNVKNVETPRPLKLTRSHSTNVKSSANYLDIEELIQLIESLAIRLSNGINNTECMMLLNQNLRVHGPQLELVAKDSLDRSFVMFRNASQDERLNIMSRLNLLELIELRAKNWEDNGMNNYYKSKANVMEPNEIIDVEKHTPDLKLLIQNHHQLHQAAALQTLSPGEIIKNSGKFIKPTRIPGKNYCKDEVVIRNADSGKVMGIKGRRVHMIEELSETIISFQRVSPGAKERLVQITGQCENKINYAKHLIEDTIRRNASPIRNPPPLNSSVSPVSSSISDEQNISPIPTNPSGIFQHQFHHQNNNPALLHSLSANDASVAEFKYTVNVGQHVLKITGESCELVRIAKLVLDDYFSGTEFLAGSAFEVPLTPGGCNIDVDASVMPPNYLSGQFFSTNTNPEEELFVPPEETPPTRRNHFSRRDLIGNAGGDDQPKKDEQKMRTTYQLKQLIFYAKSPHSRKIPDNWTEICRRIPSAIVKDPNTVEYFNADKYLEMLEQESTAGSRQLEQFQVQENLENDDK